MVGLLQEIYYINTQPTLTSYINSFEDTWVEQTELLQARLEEAQNLIKQVKTRPWSVTRMLRLFSEQIELLKAVKTMLNTMKHSDLYKMENGITTPKESQENINIGHFQGVWGNVENSTINQVFANQIEKGNLESLVAALESARIASPDLDDLKTILEEEQPISEHNTGPRLSEWIGKMVSKSANGSWKFSLNVASGVLSKAITSYYGW